MVRAIGWAGLSAETSLVKRREQEKKTLDQIAETKILGGTESFSLHI